MTPSVLARSLLAASLSLAALATATPSASADPHPTHAELVSANPANNTPDVLDGHVDSFAQVGDTMIVGGLFTKVDDGTQVYDRDNIFAFSVSTGHVLPAFAASADDEVFDLQLTPDQHSVIVVGGFSAVDGQPKTGRVAKISATTGAVDPTFVAPRPNKLVRDVVYANGLYYIAGSFDTLGGQPRDYIAALEPDGSDSGVAALSVTGTNDGGATNVRSIDVNPAGTKLAVIGNFSAVDGEPRGQLALLDITSTSTTLDAWSTVRYARKCGPQFDTYMRDVAFAPSGDYFVVAVTGGPRGMQRSRLLCDSVSRWDLAGGADSQPTWIDYTGGDTLTAAIVDTNVIYIGGHQRFLNNSFGHNEAGPGSVSRHGVAALDPHNGLPYDWNPTRKRGYGVYGFALTASGLWVGSDTNSFGHERHGRIAFCPLAGGEDLPAYVAGAIPGRLALMRRNGKIQVMSFDGTSVGVAHTVQAARSWGRVRGTFVVDDTLFTGWSSGKMTERFFDGTTLGPPTEINLRKGFRDIGKVGAMFFDAARHRLYYTLRGADTLYYRYFQPQDAVVGSWRFTAPVSTDVSWSKVGAAVLIKGKLFFAQSQTGDLRRVGWDAATGTTIGPVKTVLGPSVDGHDFRAHGMVALD